MAPPASGAPETVDVILKLMKPGTREPQNFTINVNLSSTVRQLRDQIQESAPDNPAAASLRLIYGGRQLADDTTLREAFRSGLESPNPIYLHVVIRPNPSPPRSTTIPARSFFSSQPASSGSSRGPTPQPAAPSPTPTTPQGRAQNPNGGNTQVFSFNRQVTITATGTFIRSTRTRIQEGASDGSGQGSSSTSLGQNSADAASGSQYLPQTTSIRFSTPGSEAASSSQYASSPGRFLNLGSNPQSSPFSHFDSPLENYDTSGSVGTPQQQYYLLQGPEGQGSILLSPVPSATSLHPWTFPPPRIRSPLAPIGSYMTPPPGLNLNEIQRVNERLPAEIAAQELGRVDAERQGIREQLPGINGHFRDRMLQQRRQELVDMIDRDFRNNFPLPQPNQAAAPDQFVPAQVPGAALAGAVPVPVRPRGPVDYLLSFIMWFFGGNLVMPNEAAIEGALRWLGENFWLAVKLAFGVYLLGGGRDTRRDIVLWVAATIVFLAQSGILHLIMHNRFQNILDRINAIVPDAERPAQPEQVNNREQDGMPNPQQLADRLIQEHNNRQNGGIWDNIQTSVGIFMASLVPGLGERVGNARRMQQEAIEAMERAAQAEQEHRERVAGEGEQGADGDINQNQARPAGEGAQGAANPPNPPPQQVADVQPLFGL
ncbi:hypothetical protein TWF730_010599 [Orbilia blumenaviensis]|uniref:Ubiquitin-like domain-containing protein n=1 Tax=Orbilia blumenaviensis TaxID=1796055 RepID=A0AAV9UPY1_9PEZI